MTWLHWVGGYCRLKEDPGKYDEHFRGRRAMGAHKQSIAFFAEPVNPMPTANPVGFFVAKCQP